jgi:hypothetical protein
MENDLRTHPDSMFIKCRPFDDIRFEGIINMGYELECQSLENSCRRNTMCEEVIKFCSYLEDSCRRMFVNDLLRDMTDQGFPIRGWDGCLVCYFLAIK